MRITLQKASEIILNKNPTLKIRACLEFEKFFLFTLAPLYISSDDDYVTGRIFPAVDKKTGRIFQYDLTSDYETFEQAKKVI